ncbi:MAG: ABC transporter permease subunit [Sulfolobales archaeon]
MLRLEEMFKPLKAIFWKEFLELVRDYRTLLVLTLMPLLSMPLIGFMMVSLQQVGVPVVEIIMQDQSYGILNGTKYTADQILSYVENFLEQRGIKVLVNETSGASIDLMIVIPQDFTANLTSLTSQAYLVIYQVPGSSNAGKALNEVYALVRDLSSKFSVLKIEYLSSLSGLSNVDPLAVRDPVSVNLAGFIAPSGAGISPSEAWRIFVARMIAFSFLFVATPAITYIVDSILGEKERKTLEILLSTPIKRTHMIFGKLFASSLIGLIAALVDVLSILIFFMIISFAYQGGIPMVGIDILILSGLVVYLTVLATLSLALPIIVRSSTVRTAQVASSIITIVSTIAYFSVLFVDYYSLDQGLQYLLLLIPYTASIIAIQMYSLGDVIMTLVAMLSLAIFSISLIILTTRILDEEKMLMKPL